MRMKRLLMLFAIAVAAIACDKKEGTDPGQTNPLDGTITIISEETQWVDSVEGIYEIEYAITNASEGTKLEADSNVDWIRVLEIKESVVSYLVKANDESGERRGKINLKYGKAKAEVTVMQHFKIDQEFKATTTAGSLFQHCDNANNVHSYFVVLSTQGVKDDGSMYATAKYYCFDLYATEAPSKEAASTTIPNGTYHLSTTGELSDRSINYMYSYYLYGDEIAFSDAEVVVSDGSIIANVSLADGENHRIEYNGSLEIPVYSNTVTEGLSTLVDDHYFDIENGVFVGAFVGDLMYNGCNTCQVFMYEYLDYETGEERGDQFQIDLQLPAGSRDVCGTYTHGTTAGHFIPGSAEDLGGQYMQQNSWYMTAGYVEFAPLVRGSVTVAKEGGMYIFTLDTADDRGNIIRGTFKGSGEFIDW